MIFENKTAFTSPTLYKTFEETQRLSLIMSGDSTVVITLLDNGGKTLTFNRKGLHFVVFKYGQRFTVSVNGTTPITVEVKGASTTQPSSSSATPSPSIVTINPASEGIITAADGQLVAADTRNGAVIVNAPTSGTFAVSDAYGNAAINSIVVAFTVPLHGTVQNMTLDRNNSFARFTWTGQTFVMEN